MHAMTRSVTDDNLDTEPFFILFAANLYFTVVLLGMMDFKSISLLYFETRVTYFSFILSLFLYCLTSKNHLFLFEFVEILLQYFYFHLC